jgi:hypothetical protein
MLGSGMETADRHHGRVLGIDIAADQSLQAIDHPRTDHDRISRGVRIGTMAADAAHQHIDGIDIGQRETGAVADHPRRKRPVVKGDGVGRLGESGEQPVGHHRIGPGDDFLRRLPDHHQRPRPARLVGD